jgi:hypothetical protein
LITIPQSYLTWIVGTLYELDTLTFWADLKALEASETGIVFGDLQDHNEDYTVAGTTYADSVFLKAAVTFEDTGSPYSIRLVGSNNDIFDVEAGIYQPSGNIVLIPGNSAGLIVVETMDAATISAKIDALVAAQGLTNAQKEAEHITQASVAPLSQPGKVILRNTVTLQRWEADAWEDEGATIGYRGKGLEKVGMLTEVAYS